ncbi:MULTISPECIES: hypothetical protein [unclassified Nocardioides]|uniref:hypothetical protein n=1 Tax=unclassified Nocardioides TaxID=2615069 RepID=UPI0009F0D77B|nr:MULTISPECIES: hypothetical protein [unclassified Nocardioides]GAW49401.1 hypothetical protein PD653B2_1723 [Nocardioides sp. PD653-B2]GAW55085.1 hypothetical protein PD653_2504 [Nocardioides sp. PD653]
MPASVAFLSDRLTSDHKAALHRAQILMENDKAWTDWLVDAGVRGGPLRSIILTVDDREKVQRSVRGDGFSYKVDAGRIVDADQRGQVVSEWLAIHGEMFDYWAEKKVTTPHPPLPDPDAQLPAEVEERLAAMRADQMLEATHDDYLAELIDQDEED